MNEKHQKCLNRTWQCRCLRASNSRHCSSPAKPLAPEWRKVQRENERLNRDIERLREELLDKEQRLRDAEKQIADAEKQIAGLERKLAMRCRTQSPPQNHLRPTDWLVSNACGAAVERRAAVSRVASRAIAGTGADWRR
jgi:septal ring factor EnvC (AmiA/AmiB activator)